MSNSSSDALLSHQDLRELCMARVGAHETFPFGLETMVFKVGTVQPDGYGAAGRAVQGQDVCAAFTRE